MVRCIPGEIGVYIVVRATQTSLLFQEEPFKLVILAKDVSPHCVAYSDFIFSSEGQFYVVTGDEEGIVRLYEYDPSG